MLRLSNISCARRSTWVLGCIAAWCLACAVRGADGPSEADCRAAFETARRWVDAVAVPHVDASEAAHPIEGATGVCVLLWRSGRVVGTGTDWAGDDLMLRRAVARALGELLGEPAVQGLPDEMRGTVGGLVSIELEIAGERTPIVAPTFEHAGRQLDPGIDGIALRRGRDWALRFPAQFRATNTAGAAHRQFLALAADLDLPPLALAEMKAAHNVAAYAFRTTTLAQPAPGETPFVAVRGEQIIDLDVVTAEHLMAWIRDAAENLGGAVAPPVRDAQGTETPAEPMGLLGAYNPLADAYEPLFAPPIEQALGAYALMVASRSPLLPLETRGRCHAASCRILGDLRIVTSIESDPYEHAPTCALVVATIVLTHEADGQRFEDLHSRAANRLMQSFVPTQSFDTSLTPHERALVAWGLVQLSLHDPLTLPRATAHAAVESAWTHVVEQERVALLPWIGWALRDLAGDEAEPEHADALRELAAGLCASRVRADHRTFADDLAGGIPLVASGRAQPTSQTLRPASWLASALRDPALMPPDDRAARLDELREIIRFVRQLMVRDDTAWRYRNKRRALGGFRAATWDVTQPVPAQALGLLTLLEAARTLQDAEKQQPNAAQPRKSP